MKKINVLLITTVSMFAFAAQAMEHRGKKQGKKYLQSLKRRRIYKRDGVTGAINTRKLDSLRKDRHQKLVYEISKRTDPQQLLPGQLLRGRLAPKILKPVMDEQVGQDVMNEQVRQDGVAFLQAFTAANRCLREINIEINLFRDFMEANKRCREINIEINLLRDFVEATRRRLEINIEINLLRGRAPGVIAELIRTGNGYKVVPYILKELN